MEAAVERGARRRGARLFADAVPQPRARRAGDVFLLAGSLLSLLALGALAVPQPGFAGAFDQLAEAMPYGLDGMWQLLIALMFGYSLVLIGWALVRRRWGIARDLGAAAAIAYLGVLLTARLATGGWSGADVTLDLSGRPTHFPPALLAVPAAVAIAAAPHLVRPARRLGWILVAASATGIVFFLIGTILGVAAAIAVGTAAASIVHLIFGSSTGRPSLDDVAQMLGTVGVEADSLGIAQRQPSGSFVVNAVGAGGNPLTVKVFSRDAYNTQLLAGAWRTVWYRETGAPPSLGRLAQAEHEALLTMLAHEAGIPTARVIVARVSPDGDVALVTAGATIVLADATPTWNRDVVAGAWRVLGILRERGIAHGQLDDRHLSIADGAVGLTDFSGATMTPTPVQQRTDAAQLIVASAVGASIEEAVGAAHQLLGDDELAATLPLIQPPALTSYQRKQVDSSGLDLGELRSQAAQRCGVEAPQLQKLRRVTIGSVLQSVVLVFAFVAVATAAGNLDLSLLAQEVADATWWLLFVGVVIAQTPRVAMAVSVLGASPTPMPMGPVYVLQLATSYLSLAVPSSAARIAMNIRFFQRHGVRSGTAVAVGALDSVAQVIVQILLLVGLLLLTPFSLELDLSGSEPSGMWRLILIVGIAALAAIGLVVAVGRWRRFVVSWGKRLAGEALETLRGLQSPRRLAMLFGGNLAAEILFPLALQVILLGFGYHIGLAELILINVSVSILSGIIPVPGGIGVIEAGLTFGLVAAGVPEQAAFAAVIVYRIATFYLPPTWGYFALRWLERNNHL